MGEVAALKPANDAPEAQRAEGEVPAFEIAVSANFADLQQVMLRMPVKEPLTREEANRRLDLVVDMAQRQVSRQEIRLNEAALRDKRAALERQHRVKAEAGDNHTNALAAIAEEIILLKAKRAKVIEEGAADHAARGRQDDYKPEGATKNKVTAFDRAIDAAAAKAQKLEGEFLQLTMKPIDEIIDRLKEEIDAIQRMLAKHREIVG